MMKGSLPFFLCQLPEDQGAKTLAIAKVPYFPSPLHDDCVPTLRHSMESPGQMLDLIRIGLLRVSPRSK